MERNKFETCVALFFNETGQPLQTTDNKALSCLAIKENRCKITKKLMLWKRNIHSYTWCPDCSSKQIMPGESQIISPPILCFL